MPLQLHGKLLTRPLNYDEGTAPQEVDGIGSMRSFERPVGDDLLGLGDLELVLTPILPDLMRIHLQHLVTWPLRHWKVAPRVDMILQTE